ncbi:MAG: hypothetical protein KA788_06655, partial [Lacunisphaera sp.]|nr:hypothetical protein [Lacunisphaera sp.]
MTYEEIVEFSNKVHGQWSVPEETRDKAAKDLEVGQWPADEDTAKAFKTAPKEEFEKAVTERQGRMADVTKARETEQALKDQDSLLGTIKSAFSPAKTPEPRSVADASAPSVASAPVPLVPGPVQQDPSSVRQPSPVKLTPSPIHAPQPMTQPPPVPATMAQRMAKAAPVGPTFTNPLPPPSEADVPEARTLASSLTREDRLAVANSIDSLIKRRSDLPTMEQEIRGVYGKYLQGEELEKSVRGTMDVAERAQLHKAKPDELSPIAELAERYKQKFPQEAAPKVGQDKPSASAPVPGISARQPLGELGTEIVGKTDEGRPIVKNPDGSVSTERSVTVEIDGKWVNIPSMFGGKEVSEEEAVNIMQQNGMVDPETGRTMPTFNSLEEAETAARARSENDLGRYGNLAGDTPDLTLPEVVVTPNDSPDWMRPDLEPPASVPTVPLQFTDKAGNPIQRHSAPVPLANQPGGPVDPGFFDNARQTGPNTYEIGKAPTMGDNLQEAVNHFMQGAIDIPASALKAVAVASATLDKYLPEAMKNPATVEERMTYKLGETVTNLAREMFPTDPARQEEFLYAVLPRALGSMTGFLAGGVAGAVAKAPVTTTAVLGAAAGGAEGYEDAKEHGADEGTKEKAFWMNAGVGTSEAVPIGHMLARFNQATGGRFMHILKTSGIAAAEEFLQEFFQTTAGNVIARDVLEYDKQRSLLEGATKAGEAGGAAGGILGLIVGAIGGRRASMRSAGAKEPEPEAVERPQAQQRPVPVERPAPLPQEIRQRPADREATEAAQLIPERLETKKGQPYRIPQERATNAPSPVPVERPAQESRPSPVERQQAVEAPVPVERPTPETKSPVIETKAHEIETKGQVVETPTPVERETPAPSKVNMLAEEGDASASPVKAEESAPVPLDAAAHEAATSPQNDLPEPTEAQKEQGNYKKGHVKIAGLDISIENPQGSTRSGTDASGTPWSVEMQSHYGYIKGTVGKDKDHIDVFVKPGTPEAYNGPVFVVDQVDPKTGKFDEHKAILGAVDIDEAKKMYRENYAKDWKGLGTISATPMREFRDWLNRGNTKKPFHQSKESTVLAPEEPAKLPADLIKPAPSKTQRPDRARDIDMAEQEKRPEAAVSPEGQSFIDRFKSKGFIYGTVKSGDADRLALLLDAYKLPYEGSGKRKITFKHLPGKPFKLGGYHVSDRADAVPTKAEEAAPVPVSSDVKENPANITKAEESPKTPLETTPAKGTTIEATPQKEATREPEQPRL